MKGHQVFKRIRDPREQGFDFEEVANFAIEAEFQLPNDGTPTPNTLVVQVIQDNGDDDTVIVRLVSRTSRDRVIMVCNSVPIEAVGNMLYGVAKIETKEFLSISI